MKKIKNLVIVGGLIACQPVMLNAQDLMIYPAKGQSAQQQDKDKYECYGFAKNQSGFDPMALPTTSTPPPAKEEKQGGVGSGAVKGGIGGALIGALAGDTKKGAAIGAVGGGVVGGVRSSEQKKREAHNRQQWEQNESQQYANNRNSYNRAYAACLEGRGYTVR